MIKIALRQHTNRNRGAYVCRMKHKKIYQKNLVFFFWLLHGIKCAPLIFFRVLIHCESFSANCIFIVHSSIINIVLKAIVCVAWKMK